MIRKFLFSALLCIAGLLTMAQPSIQSTNIPADTAVRVGTLPNGMTYYIRHNDKPANQGEFYIFHNVGAMQEEESQIGLAHFLEHMAFNGTKNLPGKQLIHYLESVGVKFGANLNAATGQEMTVYNMSGVPLTREGILDTALLILHDWSHFIALEPSEIDAERGVIVEELRTRNSAQFRVGQMIAPTLYNHSKYADRNIIGTEKQLRTFSHQELVDFYHRWYRPDLQAIIVVGDVDMNQVEAKLKKLMADIPAPQQPERKQIVAIPDNNEPLIDIATDPELTSSRVDIYFKREPLTPEMNGTLQGVQLNTWIEMIARMADYRLAERAQQPDAPFLSAGASNGALTQTCDVLFGAAIARTGETDKAFEGLYTELEKMYRFGFTPSEFERIQKEMMSTAKAIYDGRNDRRNNEFVQVYIDHYSNGTPIPDALTEWKMDSTTIASATLEKLNELVPQLLGPKNQVIIISSPEKEDVPVPTENTLRSLIAKVHTAQLEAYQDNMINEPLVSTPLKGSRVKKSSTDHFGATVWTLGNGARVVLLPTEYKADQIMMRATARGGLSLVATEDYPTAELLTTVMEASGAGKFSATELTKQLAGKMVMLRTSVREYENVISGTTTVKDLETLLQLTYLTFTAPRFNPTDFNMVIDKYRSSLSNAAGNPSFILSDTANNTLYGHNPRRATLKVSELEKVKYERLNPLFQQLFGNAAAYNFTFVGNIDLETVKPLIEKYIGSLPASKVRMEAIDDGAHPVKGTITNRFSVPMQVPKSTVVYFFTGDMPYTLENQFTLSVLKQVLDIRYIKSIREEKGGTYGVRTQTFLDNAPGEGYSMQILFDTDPDLADELMEIVMQEIEKISIYGPQAEDIAKIQEYMLKQRADNLKKNPIWLNYLDTYYVDGLDMNDGYDKLIEELDGSKVKEMAAKILSDRNIVKIVMDPAPQAAQ